MTALCSFTFPPGSTLPGRVIRAYATGRYLNNSGGALTPTLTTIVNSVVQSTVTPAAFASSTIAVGWFCWAHFYVTQAQTPAGAFASIGSNLHVGFTWNHALATTTGVALGNQYFNLLTNPYTTVITPNGNNALEVDFNLAGGDVLEVHAATMEAL